MTIYEAYLLWQKEYWSIEGNLLENTIRGYISIYNRHILPVVGNNDISNINTDALQNYYNSLRNDGISAKTIRNINQALESLINWCFHRKIISAKPEREIILPKKRGQNNIRNFLSEEEWKQIKPLLRGQYKFAILFYTETGIRPEEIAILKSNINNHFIYIRTAVKRKYTDYNKRTTVRVCSEYLKSKAAYRSIPITPNVQSVIERQELFLKRKHIQSDYLFCNIYGDLPELRNISRSLHSAMKRAGVEKKGLNSLRKLYIKRMVKNGMQPKTLQKIVGHEEFSTTMKYYLEVSDQDKYDEALSIYEKMNKI